MISGAVRRFAASLCASSLLCTGSLVAEEADPHFAFLKSLEGRWVVTTGREHLPLTGEEAAIPEVIWEYRITANGHALTETIMVGTSQEMFTVYHMNGGRVEGTHYCTFNNQPRYVAATPFNKGGYALVCDGHVSNAASHDDNHMHAIEHELLDDGRLRVNAPGFHNGALIEAPDLYLTRKAEQ